MYPDFYTDIGKFYILSSGLTTPPAPRFMGINHGGAYIAVAEMFLYGADVVV